MRIDAERARDIRITLIEGAQLLGSFDARLREYAARKLHDQGIHLVKVCFVVRQLCNHVSAQCPQGKLAEKAAGPSLSDAAQSMVKEVKDKELVLQNGDVLPYGLCVWCEPNSLFSSFGFVVGDLVVSLPAVKHYRLNRCTNSLECAGALEWVPQTLPHPCPLRRQPEGVLLWMTACMCWCTLTKRTMGPNPRQRYDDGHSISLDFCCVVHALACFLLSTGNGPPQAMHSCCAGRS